MLVSFYGSTRSLRNLRCDDMWTTGRVSRGSVIKGFLTRSDMFSATGSLLSVAVVEMAGFLVQFLGFWFGLPNCLFVVVLFFSFFGVLWFWLLKKKCFEGVVVLL